MGVIVQKFGGTSVATAEKILAAAKRAIAAKDQGHHVAVVVSARGHTTDELIDLAKEIHPNPPAREMDMLVATGEQVSIALLAMAIQSLGYGAVSLTGGQMGIVTDSIHGKARIREISTDRIRAIFEQGKIAIVAGFQGIDQDQNITTLGRGGSDTTAVAIAAALGADVCEIYTDVTGVFTTDPRIVPDARKIDQISYDEMLELASVGAGVMHSRSIEFAKKFGTLIHVRHAGKEDTGTVILPENPVLEHVVVRGAALARDEARVTLHGVPDTPGVVHKIFSDIAGHSIVVDMIVQNIAHNGRTEVSFTVPHGDLEETLALTQRVADEIGAEKVDSSTDVSKVSVVGLGMRTHAGVAERMFSALSKQGINVRMITTSEIKMSVLVSREQGEAALKAVHQEFELHHPLPELQEDIGYRLKRARTAEEVEKTEERLHSIARSLPTMEDILVSNVDADTTQARVTIYGIPDRPGTAYQTFQRIAAEGVPVDMIVQNVGSDQTTHLSITVPKDDLDKATGAVKKLMAEFGEGDVVGDAAMTKISVRGVGMRSHVGVAVGMFRALSEHGINIQLINTSELHITVVVAADQTDVALAALRKTFNVSE